MGNEDDEQNVMSYENAGRLVISTLFYPIENLKILVQMGHEPLPPFPTKTLFGTPALGLPNAFTLVKHVYTVDGLRGCYRGFIPWMSTNLMYRFIQNRTKESFPKMQIEDRNEEDLTEEERLTLYTSSLFRGVVSRTVAIIVSQPLHVITVRTIAQFVGRETKYSGVLSSLWTVLKEEGILGLFCGLLPRLLADIFIYTAATTGIYLAHEFITKDQEIRKFVDTIIQYMASACFYPLSVVSTCMAVTNSGLVAGSPPHMPHYHDMFDCWRHLMVINQHKRGSSVLWRYYTPVSDKLLANER